MISYAEGQSQNAVVKTSSKLLKKGSVILVSSAPADQVAELTKDSHYPDAEVFVFTKETMNTTSKFLSTLEEVNTQLAEWAAMEDLEDWENEKPEVTFVPTDQSKY